MPDQTSNAQPHPPAVPNDDWAHPFRVEWLLRDTNQLNHYGHHVVEDLCKALVRVRAELEAERERQ